MELRSHWYSNKVFKGLLQQAHKTTFGIDHNFESIHSHYCRLVLIREYEGFVNYIQEGIDVINKLNNKPRKIFEFNSPNEILS